MLGDGPPLVKTANWLNHIEHDWESPLWRHWIEQFTEGRSLVRYDERGNGLSDWDTPELSFEAFIDDLEMRRRLPRRSSGSTCSRSARARRSRSLMRCGIPSGCGGW